MVAELRLYPRASAARTWSRCLGRSAGLERRVSEPSLSTAFAEGSRLGLHRAASVDPPRRAAKEDVD
jgi:hypothetical protein